MFKASVKPQFICILSENYKKYINFQEKIVAEHKSVIQKQLKI